MRFAAIWVTASKDFLEICDISWHFHILNTMHPHGKFSINVYSFFHLHSLICLILSYILVKKLCPGIPMGTGKTSGRYYLGRWAFCFPETCRVCLIHTRHWKGKLLQYDIFWKLWCICCLQHTHYNK